MNQIANILDDLSTTWIERYSTLHNVTLTEANHQLMRSIKSARYYDGISDAELAAQLGESIDRMETALADRPASP